MFVYFGHAIELGDFEELDKEYLFEKSCSCSERQYLFRSVRSRRCFF